MKENVQKAIRDLKDGKFIFVYDADGREEETDFIKAAQYAKHEDVLQMRKDGGGLIFLLASNEVHNKFDLPYLTELYEEGTDEYPVLDNLSPTDIPYDVKSSFSVTLNHRKTYTGVTDKDRALTIREFAYISREAESMSEEFARALLGKNFRSPGHIPICSASAKPLEERFGHTELGVALLTMAELTPVGVGCEMMGDDGDALKKEDAKAYAEERGLTFLEGKDVVEAWKEIE